MAERKNWSKARLGFTKKDDNGALSKSILSSKPGNTAICLNIFQHATSAKRDISQFYSCFPCSILLTKRSVVIFFEGLV